MVIQEWIEGVPMAEIIRHGTPEQRDLIGTRLLELTFDAPRRLEMMHGDAHPGNFMLLPDGRMGVIDFGAVAPLPGGLPIELGMTIRLARDKNYDLLLPTMEKAGFIQKGQQVSVRDIDEMLRQYVEPIEVEVFHYTRKWLQRMTASQMDRSVPQIRAARQMDLPPKLAIPMRVIASVAAILCQLDAHVPIKALSEELIPGFAEPDTARRSRAIATRPRETVGSCTFATAVEQRPSLRGRPRGRLRLTIEPRSKISPPQTPQGSARSSAAARHWRRIGQLAQSILARSRSAGVSANHKSGSPT